MSEVRVGISGWNYKPWRGNFYPRGLKQKLELPFASRMFNALEVNGTFYSLKTPSAFQSWYDATPKDFVFTLKGGRFLTHMRKLRKPRQPLANYFASGVLRLREKLGPILWQFPPNLGFDEDRFRQFFAILPRDTVELAQLARGHDPSLKKRVELEPDKKRPVRHAIEFRHESFLKDRFIDMLRQHRIALVIADVASKFPTAEDVTTDLVYIRLHGSRQLYASGYTPREIRAWATKIKIWHSGREPSGARRIAEKTSSTKRERDVYVFFDNTDVKLRAPVDARAMASVLGVGPRESLSEVMANLSST